MFIKAISKTCQPKTIKRRRKPCLHLSAIALGLCTTMLCNTALGHSRWVIPSHSILSGDKAPMVSIDFSISNDIFHPDLALGGIPIQTLSNNPKNKQGSLKNDNPMLKMLNSTRVNVITPEGSTGDDLAMVNLGRKSATAFTLEQSGTYRINVIQNPVDVTLFKKSDGTPSRLFGPLKAVKDKLPSGASDLKTLHIYNDIHTYVTRNALTTKAVTPKGTGLELKHSTHPNELFAKEAAQYTLLFNGKAITNKTVQQSVDLKITRHNTRYRNQRNTETPSLNSKGEFSITWPEPGLYLIEGELSLPSTSTKASSGKITNTDIHAFFLTVEVTPQ